MVLHGIGLQRLAIVAAKSLESSKLIAYHKQQYYFNDDKYQREVRLGAQIG
jgi:hypothetical protein